MGRWSCWIAGQRLPAEMTVDACICVRTAPHLGTMPCPSAVTQATALSPTPGASAPSL